MATSESDSTQRPAIGQPCPHCGRIGPSYITHAEVERRLDAALAYDFRPRRPSRPKRDRFLIFGYGLLAVVAAIVGGAAWIVTVFCTIACVALIASKGTP